MEDLLIRTEEFDIDQILESGQTFRWSREGDTYTVLDSDRCVHIKRVREGHLLFPILSESDLSYWRNYFDLDTDYSEVISELSEKDSILKESASEYKGIRILRQDRFQTLISFIISANNNIPRIRKIIDRICMSRGRQMDGFIAFPTPEELSSVSTEDYMSMGAGYRAGYLSSTVSDINSGFDIDSLSEMSYEDAKKRLLTLKGIGPKVADCILLFAYHRTEAFPIDTWIKKVLEVLYGRKLINRKETETFIAEHFGRYAGIAQQYLFCHARDHMR